MQKLIMIICNANRKYVLNLDVHVYVITIAKNTCTTNESQTKLRTFQGKQ